MTDSGDKLEKKLAKARVKAAKAEASVRRTSGGGRLPEGVGIAILRREEGAELVVSGLKDDQLERLIPHVTKEVQIAVTEDRDRLRAGMMRFVREGVFHTVIKVVAGLVVGYVLIKVGLR